MKIKFSIIHVLLFLFANSMAADVGECVRYKVQITLKDSSVMSGHIQLLSHNPMTQLSDSLFYEALKSVARYSREEVTLFRRIQTIEYPQIFGQHYNFRFSAVADEDKAIIDFRSVESINLLELDPCEHGTFDTQGISPFSIHYYARVIDNLKQHEIDLLQKAPIYTVIHHVANTAITFVAVSYNQSVPKTLMEKTCSELYRLIENKTDKDTEINVDEEHYNRVKGELRAKKIVLLKLRGHD